MKWPPLPLIAILIAASIRWLLSGFDVITLTTVLGAWLGSYALSVSKNRVPSARRRQPQTAHIGVFYEGTSSVNHTGLVFNYSKTLDSCTVVEFDPNALVDKDVDDEESLTRLNHAPILTFREIGKPVVEWVGASDYHTVAQLARLCARVNMGQYDLVKNNCRVFVMRAIPVLEREQGVVIDRELATVLVQRAMSSQDFLGELPDLAKALLTREYFRVTYDFGVVLGAGGLEVHPWYFVLPRDGERVWVRAGFGDDQEHVADKDVTKDDALIVHEPAYVDWITSIHRKTKRKEA